MEPQKTLSSVDPAESRTWPKEYTQCGQPCVSDKQIDENTSTLLLRKKRPDGANRRYNGAAGVFRFDPQEKESANSTIQILLLKRAKSAAEKEGWAESFWEPPGGGIELREKHDENGNLIPRDDTVGSGTLRELWEETTLKGEIKAMSDPMIFGYLGQNLQMNFIVVCSRQRVKLSHEHCDYAWVSELDLKRFTLMDAGKEKWLDDLSIRRMTPEKMAVVRELFGRMHAECQSGHDFVGVDLDSPSMAE